MAYVSPALRKMKAVEQPTSIVESDFPSLSGSGQGSKPSGIETQTSTPNTFKYKQVILDRIQRELIDDQRLTKGTETDPHKMSVNELNVAGWAVLPLTTPNLCERFNISVQTDTWVSPTVAVPRVSVPRVSVPREPEVESESESESD